jgi:hypothetical protein
VVEVVMLILQLFYSMHEQRNGRRHLARTCEQNRRMERCLVKSRAEFSFKEPDSVLSALVVWSGGVFVSHISFPASDSDSSLLPNSQDSSFSTPTASMMLTASSGRNLSSLGKVDVPLSLRMFSARSLSANGKKTRSLGLDSNELYYPKKNVVPMDRNFFSLYSSLKLSTRAWLATLFTDSRRPVIS